MGVSTLLVSAEVVHSTLPAILLLHSRTRISPSLVGAEKNHTSQYATLGSMLRGASHRQAPARQAVASQGHTMAPTATPPARLWGGTLGMSAQRVYSLFLGYDHHACHRTLHTHPSHCLHLLCASPKPPRHSNQTLRWVERERRLP